MQVLTLALGFASCFAFASVPDTPAVLPIDEAERATEQLLGPYTGEEHVKRGIVVREPSVNRAYMDPVVRLVERANPDAGKKKRVRGLEELEGHRPISAVPLWAVEAAGADRSGHAGEDARGLASKKLPQALGAPQEISISTSSSSAALLVAPRAGVVEVVASSFGIASMPLEELSIGTPSQVYGGRTEDTRVEVPHFACAATRIVEGGSGGGADSGVGGSIGGFDARRGCLG